jgi:hypothetical protein
MIRGSVPLIEQYADNHKISVTGIHQIAVVNTEVCIVFDNVHSISPLFNCWFLSRRVSYKKKKKLIIGENIC